MFGIKRLSLAAVDPADLRRFAVIVHVVAEWRSNGSANERLVLGRLRHTMAEVLKDVEHGKIPELTQKTIEDLLYVAEFFNDESAAVAERSASQSHNPDEILKASALLRQCAVRVATGLKTTIGPEEPSGIPVAEVSPTVQENSRPNFCMQCGTKLATVNKFCQECGRKVA